MWFSIAHGLAARKGKPSARCVAVLYVPRTPCALAVVRFRSRWIHREAPLRIAVGGSIGWDRPPSHGGHLEGFPSSIWESGSSPSTNPWGPPQNRPDVAGSSPGGRSSDGSSDPLGRRSSWPVRWPPGSVPTRPGLPQFASLQVPGGDPVPGPSGRNVTPSWSAPDRFCPLLSSPRNGQERSEAD